MHEEIGWSPWTPFLLLVCTLWTISAAGADQKAECETSSGKDCHSCLQHVQCYYCTSSKACTYYPWKTIFPKSDTCSMANVRWGTCWVNFEALLISVCVIVLVLVASLTVWCHCWCKRRRRRSVDRDIARFERERQERQEAQAQRRAERQLKTDAIREKYGLPSTTRDGNPPYQPL